MNPCFGAFDIFDHAASGDEIVLSLWRQDHAPRCAVDQRATQMLFQPCEGFGQGSCGGGETTGLGYGDKRFHSPEPVHGNPSILWENEWQKYRLFG
jgi:hypothetical protein